MEVDTRAKKIVPALQDLRTRLGKGEKIRSRQIIMPTIRKGSPIKDVSRRHQHTGAQCRHWCELHRVRWELISRESSPRRCSSEHIYTYTCSSVQSEDICYRQM